MKPKNKKPKWLEDAPETPLAKIVNGPKTKSQKAIEKVESLKKMFEKNPPPKWLEDEPQTPLEVSLYGKVYSHSIVCSGDRRKPPGTPNSCCCCLNLHPNPLEPSKDDFKKI